MMMDRVLFVVMGLVHIHGSAHAPGMDTADYRVHPSSVIDPGAQIGARTQVWHFCHVMAGARIGADCTLGQNVFVASRAIVGDRVKIQNNVSVYDGVVIDDDVFLGPSCVLTNVRNPRADRAGQFETTYLESGCTVGANATIVCGVRIGQYALIAAGAVVTDDVPPHALMVGVPARRVAWVGRAGCRLETDNGAWICPETAERYTECEGRLVHLN